MNKKRFLSLFLALGLAATTLVGCGGGADAPAEKPEGDDVQVEETEEKDNVSQEGLDESEVFQQVEAVIASDMFPLSEEIEVTFAGVREDGNVPFEDQKLFQALEEATNMKINWLDWPQSQQKEKRNLAFASGDLPDALYGSWTLDAPDIVEYGGAGMLLEFDEYIDSGKMPNFAHILENEPGLREAISTPDGKVYALPTMNRNALPQTNDTMVINTEWLEAVGMDMPTTTDELFDVLMAFKEAGDLNGNGRDDEIPMTFHYGEGNTGLFGLMGFTGITMNNKNSRMAMKDGEPVFMAATDEYKEYLLYMNKLYENGLLDREAFTYDGPSYNAKTQTTEPSAGVISAWTAQAINNPIGDNDVEEEGVYQYMEPVRNSDRDVDPVWGLRGNPLNGNMSFAINAQTDYADEIVEWIDLAYEKKSSVENYIGKFGVHLNDEGDDKYSKIENSEGKDFTNDEKSAYVPAKMAAAYVLDGDFNATDLIDSPQDKVAADKVYGPYLVDGIVEDTAMSTKEEGDRLAFITADLMSYMDTSTAKFITEGGIEEGWDAYIQQLKDLGLEEYVEIKTELHNRMQGN